MTGSALRSRLLTAALSLASVTLQPAGPPDVLPSSASTQLAQSLEASRAHASHVWRDTPPLNADGTVTGYVEIARGDRRKWELDMRQNRRAVDRVIPESVGGYPVNYGFVPQTVSYDGDPFDILVLGPSIEGGSLIRGAIVGLMHMVDEKGLDSKVVLSPIRRDGRPAVALTSSEQFRIGDFFKRYKLHEPGKFSKVPGWDTPEQGLAYVRMTHAFFLECRDRAGSECVAAKGSRE
jgi:inorganic pyrophosphatase